MTRNYVCARDVFGKTKVGMDLLTDFVLSPALLMMLADDRLVNSGDLISFCALFCALYPRWYRQSDAQDSLHA